MLSKCLTREEEYEFNRKKGLMNYITPFAQLFCVQQDNAPEFAKFFKSDLALPSKENLQKITNNPLNDGFISSAFKQTETTSSEPYYQIGDKMRTLVEITDRKSPSQFGNSFPFPRGDSFGICSNYKSAYFMQDDTSTCT